MLGKNGFEIIRLETLIIARAVGYGFNNDPFDKIIVASAVELNLPLITKDLAIAAANLVEAYW